MNKRRRLDGVDAGSAPLLVAVRWDWNGARGGPSTAWGSSGSSTSEQYAESLLKECAKKPNVPPVAHKMVGSTRDVWVLAEEAKAAGDAPPGSQCFYFLWPTQFADEQALSADNPGGFVGEAALFALMAANEARGMKTAFPHPHALYRKMVSKLWTVELCGNPLYCIPATTTLNRSDLLSNPDRAVEAALSTLAAIRGAVADAGSEAAADTVRLKGSNDGVVVKLGYSWEAMDVRSVPRTTADVRKAAVALVKQPGCSATSVIVQDKVPADVELRLFIIESKPVYRYFARYDACDSSTGKFLKWTRKSKEEAIGSWFSNDREAMADAERKAEALATVWAAWVSQLHPDVPAFRLDLLCARAGAGKAAVSTLELTESGFSMWGFEGGPARVFGAIANNVSRNIEAAAGGGGSGGKFSVAGEA